MNKDGIYVHEKNDNDRNEIKSYIVRAGMTMSEVVDYILRTRTVGAAASPTYPAMEAIKADLSNPIHKSYPSML